MEWVCSSSLGLTSWAWVRDTVLLGPRAGPWGQFHH